MVNVIVTGAGGRIGRILQAGWANSTALGLRPIWTGRGNGLPVQWDIANAAPKGLPQGATVLHLAGVTQGSAAALQANVDLMPPVLALCHAISARRLLVMSSASVYPSGAMNHEDGPLAPSSPYGQSKVQVEVLALTQPHTPVTILRAGNIAGADALLGPRRPAEITLDPVEGRPGGPLRSWIGARVLTYALAELCKCEPPKVLNLAQEPPLPMADLLEAADLPWRYGTTPAPVPMATQDLSRLQTLLKLPPATPAQLVEEAAWARRVLA